jgi:raffinose/stachyose/melibiose transport system permease protein
MKSVLLRKLPPVIFKLLFVLLFIAPFYVVIVYAVKSKQEIAFTGFAFPTVIHWENFSKGIEMSNFFRALSNTMITAGIGTLALTVFSSMAAYIIARRKSRLYKASYYIFMITILIPFQAIMFPLYLQLKVLGIINTLTGFTLAKVSMQMGFSVMLITGFVKSIPIDIEEAAYIDGCNRYQTFFSIVFPLMKSILLSSIVVNALSIWNDFSASVILLQSKSVANIPLMTYFFFGENVVELNLAFAVFALSMVPILVLYFMTQKYIVSGIIAGATKG